MQAKFVAMVIPWISNKLIILQFVYNFDDVWPETPQFVQTNCSTGNLDVRFMQVKLTHAPTEHAQISGLKRMRKCTKRVRIIYRVKGDHIQKCKHGTRWAACAMQPGNEQLLTSNRIQKTIIQDSWLYLPSRQSVVGSPLWGWRWHCQHIPVMVRWDWGWE